MVQLAAGSSGILSALQGPFTRDMIEEWAKGGYFPLDLAFRAESDPATDFQFHSLKTLWQMQLDLSLDSSEIGELLDLQERLREPLQPQAGAMWGGAAGMPQQAGHGGAAPFAAAPMHHAPSWAAGHGAREPAGNHSGMLPIVHENSSPGSLQGSVPAADAGRGSMPAAPAVPVDPLDAIIDFPGSQPMPARHAQQELQPFGANAAGSQTPARALAAAPGAAARAAPAPGPSEPTLAAWASSAPSQPPAPERFPPAADTQNMLGALFGGAPPQPFAPFQTPDAQMRQLNVGGNVLKPPPPPPPPRESSHERTVAPLQQPLQQRAAPAPIAPWGSPDRSRAMPANLSAIQAEEAAEKAAAGDQANMREQPRAGPWARQPPPPQAQPAFREIMDYDEECAADLEGGRCVRSRQHRCVLCDSIVAQTVCVCTIDVSCTCTVSLFLAQGLSSCFNHQLRVGTMGRRTMSSGRRLLAVHPGSFHKHRHSHSSRSWPSSVSSRARSRQRTPPHRPSPTIFTRHWPPVALRSMSWAPGRTGQLARLALRRSSSE
jgi:GYF domain